MAIRHGTTVKEIFWALGQYDAVVVVEAQDEMAMTALGLSAGAVGNVRTQTLRSFWEAEKNTILGKVA